MSHHGFEYDITGTSYEGDETTLHFGLDSRFGDGLLAGIAFSYVDAYTKAEVSGVDFADFDARLLIFNPYIAYPINDESIFWGTIGYGKGSYDVSVLEPVRGSLVLFDGETDINTQMVALGFRTEIHQIDPITLALDGSAFLLSYETDEIVLTASGIGTLTYLESDFDSSRVRLALEASGTKDLSANTILAGKFGLGIRYDNGDEEEGAGVDVAAGIDVASAKTSLTYTGELNWLLHHNEDDYEEWGLNLGLSLSF